MHNVVSVDGLDHGQLASLARWYMEMGVDLAVGETPRNRFADSARQAERPIERAAEPVARRADAGPAQRLPSPAIPPASQMQAAAMAVDAVVAQARAVAAQARTLDELRSALEAFEGCALKLGASNLVFGQGAPDARVMLMGGKPGDDDDKEGKPFAGPAGQLLDAMLAAIGLARDEVYLAQCVPWRPAGAKPPTPQEFAICQPFIERQIELVAPSLLVCLGNEPAQNILGVKEPILRARGTWREYARTGRPPVRALVTLHPDMLLRSPANKKLVWGDLRALRRALDGA